MSEYKYELDTQSRLVEAKQEGLREAARNLKKMGIAVEQIAQGTGLSVTDIAKLITKRFRGKNRPQVSPPFIATP
jgi:predicted transposase YdaD